MRNAGRRSVLAKHKFPHYTRNLELLIDAKIGLNVCIILDPRKCNCIGAWTGTFRRVGVTASYVRYHKGAGSGSGDLDNVEDLGVLLLLEGVRIPLHRVHLA